MLPMWYMAQDRTAYWDKFSFPQTRAVYSSGFENWVVRRKQSGQTPRGQTLRN
ncbi:ABC transporter [Klebsiella michiganensis]|uniref:ABC transporter n=1 Tax=Klebsiella michiganensis TaxID=1134687 RepID=A0A7H4PPM1_9ENTR|nr:ABC transporter [Klebsiella michiganensis]